jgi:hypothetical protein
MKNIIFHFIYISISGFIGYQYYSSSKDDAQLLSEIDRTLAIDSEQIQKSMYSIEKGVKGNVDAQPKYVSYLDILQEVNPKTESIYKWIVYQKNNIKDLNHADVRDSMSVLSQNTLNSIANLDLRDSFIRESHLLKALNDARYWQHFKDNPKNILTDLQNKITLDQLMIANYCLTKSSEKVEINFEGWRIAVAPKKAIYYEGEDFEGEIRRIAYSKSPNGTTFTANGKTLAIKEGIAQYKAKATNIGKQTVHATATITNPFTGNTQTVHGQLIYEVLPKCSRDCDKNP